MAHEVKKTVENVRDAIREGAHRANADAERGTRQEFGDLMSPGDKAKSMAREASEETRAEVDRAKRKLR